MSNVIDFFAARNARSLSLPEDHPDAIPILDEFDRAYEILERARELARERNLE